MSTCSASERRLPPVPRDGPDPVVVALRPRPPRRRRRDAAAASSIMASELDVLRATMRMTRLRGTCPDTETCPTLYRTDCGTGVVQGCVVTDPAALATLDLLTGETAVEVPLSLEVPA